MSLPVALLEKTRPQQARAIQTYERILAAAAGLLAEVGVERISTNLIASRAGISAPALYRYFPNKYALLYALGARLMDRQNQVLMDWSARHYRPGEPESLLASLEQLLADTLAVTEREPGGLALLRALRALPVMQDVLLESHRAISLWAADAWRELMGDDPNQGLRIRLVLQLGTAAIEMALEDPDMPRGFAVREAARMLGDYLHRALAD